MSDTPTDTPLLPCPFCGGAAEAFFHPGLAVFQIAPDCPVMGAMAMAWTDTRADLVRRWNTRRDA